MTKKFRSVDEIFDYYLPKTEEEKIAIMSVEQRTDYICQKLLDNFRKNIRI